MAHETWLLQTYRWTLETLPAGHLFLCMSCLSLLLRKVWLSMQAPREECWPFAWPLATGSLAASSADLGVPSPGASVLDSLPPQEVRSTSNESVQARSRSASEVSKSPTFEQRVGPDPSFAENLRKLGEREVQAARTRARSLLANAQVEVQSLLSAAPPSASDPEEIESAPSRESRESREAHANGVRDGHLIGMRKGETEALASLAKMLEEIETRVGSSGPAVSAS